MRNEKNERVGGKMKFMRGWIKYEQSEARTMNAEISRGGIGDTFESLIWYR